MKETGKQIFRYWRDFSLSLLKWTVFAVVVGFVVGLVGAGFHMAIDYGTELRMEHPWILYLLPVVGLLIVLSYRVTGMGDDLGTEYIIRAARDGKNLRIRTAPLIVISTVLTHFAGGSAGREGAALQLGGCISNWLGRVVHLDKKDERIITMCGMAAGFSALFGTPLAASVMAMEVVSVGVMYYSAIVPCVLASIIAQTVAGAVGVMPTAFTVSGVPEVTPLVIGQVAVLGILCAVVSILFCAVMQRTPGLYGKITTSPYVKVVIGGVVVVLLSLVFGRDYNGAGVGVIEKALQGEAKPEAFLLKMVFTGLTLAAGFKGGEIVPSFFCGATFGCVFGALLGLPASFAGALGMTAVFCGVTNCPLTAILLSLELFGGQGLTMYALCCAVSFMISGYTSLYHSQEFIHSKLRLESLHLEEK